MATKRIVLVAPCKEGQVWKGRKSHFVWPPYNLACVAADTPEGVHIEIHDEAIKPLDMDDLASADLVGVTSLTANAVRAYAIVDELRARGTATILGGIHASFMPHEAVEHADSVCIGESEGVWEEICEDVKAGRTLKKYYKAPTLTNLQQLKPPRRDLLDTARYGIPFTTMATRGCVYNCSFCSTTRFMGGKFRTRPVEEVVREIEQHATNKPFIFLDDLLHAHKKYIRELLTAMIPLKKRWVAQTTINTADDPELLALTREAGGLGCLLGIESLNEANILDVKKGISNKVEKTAERIEVFHNAGLFVQGSFIFGLDGDTPDVFDQTVQFALQTKMGAANFAVLTPLPGTDVYTRLHEAGRITSYDWDKYDKLNVVYQPKGLTPAELQQGVIDAYRKVYSLKGIATRLWPRLNTLNGWFLTGYNLSYRRGIIKGWGVGGERAGMALRAPFERGPEAYPQQPAPIGSGAAAPGPINEIAPPTLPPKFDPVPTTSPVPAELLEA